VSGGRPGGGGKQKHLTGKWNARAFDEDAKPRRGITQRIHDRGRIQFNR
jgi:hypothetical protein